MKLLQQQTSSYHYFVPSLRVEVENVVTDRETDRQRDIRDKYRNPRSACAPRVNKLKSIHVCMNACVKLFIFIGGSC